MTSAELRMMSMCRLISALVLIAASVSGWSQLPIDEANHRVWLDGRVVAYDWSDRYYMEGARVDIFVVKTTPSSGSSNVDGPRFVRVVLLWHPADKPRILPQGFYNPGKIWHLGVRKNSPYEFVRQYCDKYDAPTFHVEEEGGKKVELNRYVSPTLLPPDVDLATNFKTALARHPESPEMPAVRSMPCLYLDAVEPPRTKK